jgi:lambda repressor-like predicted transcriptional regulator
MKPLDRMDPWEVLGLDPGAPADEIRRAYERLSSRLAPGSLALYSIADRDEQSALQRRIRLAFLELMGDAADHPGQETPPPAHADREAEVAPAAAPAEPSGPEIGFDGEALQRAREEKGISLDALSHRTRIRRALLEAVEAERFAELPQRVFVRGFVFAIAGQLGLDPERVWASYGCRWEEWSAAKPPA